MVRKPFCCISLFAFFKRDRASFVFAIVLPLLTMAVSEETKIFLQATGPKYLKIYNKYWNTPKDNPLDKVHDYLFRSFG